jgi:hypothetical protein
LKGEAATSVTAGEASTSLITSDALANGFNTGEEAKGDGEEDGTTGFD